jgi:hypothetical protein
MWGIKMYPWQWNLLGSLILALGLILTILGISILLWMTRK